MRIIEKADAVQKLRHQILAMKPDDLAEVFNELFPSKLTNENQVRAEKDKFLRQINEHIAKGLEIEEIVDLWRVVFTGVRKVCYDEDSNSIQYSEEPLQYAE